MSNGNLHIGICPGVSCKKGNFSDMLTNRFQHNRFKLELLDKFSFGEILSIFHYQK
jgi:hypothetical protein